MIHSGHALAHGPGHPYSNLRVCSRGLTGLVRRVYEVRVAITSLSAAGLMFLKAHEGYRSHMYLDTAGHTTIGYGHLIHRGPIGSNPAAEAPFLAGLAPVPAGLILARDTLTAQTGVREHVFRPLQQAEFDALVSFTFNVGVNAMAGSTLVRRVNSCATHDAILDAWLMWDKPASIIPRRRAEANLFLTGQYGCPVS